MPHKPKPTYKEFTDIKNKYKELKSEYDKLFNEMTSAFAYHKMVYDKNGKPVDYVFLKVNKAFEKITGLKSKELIGKSVKTVLPQTEDYWIENYGEVSKTRKPKSFSNYSAAFDKYFEVRAYSPQPDHFAVSFIDVTKLKKHEKKLIQEDENLRIVIENMPYAVFVHDFDGNIKMVNKAACTNSGYSRKELLNMSVDDIDPQSPTRNDREKIWKKLKYGDHKRIESFHKRKDKSKYPVEITISDIKFYGEPMLLAIAQDISERKEAEKEIKQSEEKFRFIANNSTDEIWTSDLNLQLNYVSHSTINIFGFTVDERLNMKLDEIFPPSSIKKIRSVLYNEINSLTNKKKKKTPIILELEAFHKKGHLIWIEIHADFIFDIERNPIGIQGTTRDITKRKETELNLRENEKKYRTLFEMANDAIFIMKDHHFTDCNSNALKLFQCKREDIIGRTPWFFSPLYQPDGQKSEIKSRKILETALKKDINNFEWIHKKMNGDLFYSEISLNSIYLRDTKYIHAIIRDISDRKKAEETLKISEEKFRNFFNKTNDGIIITSYDHRFLEANKKAFELSGYSPSEINKYKTLDLIAPEHHGLIKDRLDILKKNKPTTTDEIEILTKNNKRIPVEINSQTIEYPGEKGAILTILRDIRIRKEMEKRTLDIMVDTQERERKRVAEDLHDEIGPYLSTIKLYTSQLQVIKEKKQREKIHNHLNELIDQLVLKIKTISNNLMPNVLTDYGLAKAIESFCDKINNSGHIQINLNIQQPEIQYKNNFELAIYRIIIELINNTLKHANASLIEVFIQEDNNSFLLTYKDNGKGFDLQTALDEDKGLGIKSIINRLKTINGNYSFHNIENNGILFNFEIKDIRKYHE